MFRFSKSMPVVVCGILLAVWCGGLALSADDPVPAKDKAAGTGAPAEREAARQALSKLSVLIGGWRGVGQPVRNSNRGAWSETADWLWDVKKEGLALVCQVKDGKVLKSARLMYEPAGKTYVLLATLPDNSTRRYSGKLDGTRLVLETASKPEEPVHQVTLTQLNEKRVVLLFQSRAPNSAQLTRIAEIGYTRQGTKLAEQGAGGPECIVTGGKGTMNLTYKGKVYYFCCTGCRDAFLADPEGIIAEAAQRAKAKKP